MRAARRRGRAGPHRQPRRSRTPPTRRCGTGSAPSRTALLHGLGDRPAPVPVDGPRVPAGHRRRGPRASAPTALPAAVPDYVVACVGGGSNAAGTFAGFVDTTARLVGVEAEGGAGADPRHASACCTACGRCSCRTTTARSLRPTRSRPGSTIPGIGPEHAHLRDLGRARYVTRRPTTRWSTAVAPAGPHRGHHRGAGVRARGRLGAPRGRRRRRCRPARPCCSPCPAAATRTSSAAEGAAVKLPAGDATAR